MKDNKRKQIENAGLYDEDLDLFGEHKSREQVLAEEKERKKAEREALKKEMERRRKDVKEGKVPTRRKDVLIVSAVLVGIVLLCVLALFNSFKENKKEEDSKINEARGHFVNEAANPEMSGEGPKADVREAYFTKDGRMCVELLISNGTDKVLAVNAMDVSAFDYVSEERIGGGRAVLDEPLIIELAGVTKYTFYIAPEHLAVAADYTIPDMVYFEISIDHTPAVVE